MRDVDTVGASQLVLRTPFQWSTEAEEQLVGHLLKGETLENSLRLLSVDFGYISLFEGTKRILEYGGLFPFILQIRPHSTKDEFRGMQTSYQVKGEEERRSSYGALAQTRRERELLARLARLQIYDQEVERRFENLLRLLEGDRSSVVSHTEVVFANILASEDPSMPRPGILVGGVILRTVAPRGRGVSPKVKEMYWIFVSRLLREVSELRNGKDCPFRRALVKRRIRKVKVQIIEREAGTSREFTAIESVLLEPPLLLK